MTVVVMCDGAPASIKAIGWASFPGFIMQRHDGEQLILVHVWSKGGLQRPLLRKDLSEKTTAQLSEKTLSLNCLPVSLVLQKTLEAINENKFLRDSLNYKIETMALNDVATAAAEGTHTLSKVTSAKKAALPIQPHVPPASTEADAEELAKQATQQRIEAIVLYVQQRALHHGAEAIILGAGNCTDGKNITVGVVGKAVLGALRHEYPLWFVKSGGCTMRPSTTALHYVVVLVPETGDNDGIEKGCLVVRQALKRRRVDKMDAVSAMLVVNNNNNTSSDELKLYLQTLEKLFDEANSLQDHQSREELLDDVVSTHIETDDGTSVENSPRKALVDIDETLLVHEVPGSNTHKKSWPDVSLCQLRPTKQAPEPTAANAPGQVVKFIQKHKTDVLVVPSTLPEELQLAFLSMQKPHVLVVPLLERKLSFDSAQPMQAGAV